MKNLHTATAPIDIRPKALSGGVRYTGEVRRVAVPVAFVSHVTCECRDRVNSRGHSGHDGVR